MTKIKDKKIKISCVGMSGKEVTGSAYLVECPTGEKILLDCGLYQSNNKYEDYKINQKKFNFKPNELTFVALTHLHIDHEGRLPLLYKRGANCKTYITYDNVEFMKPMLKDCAKIMDRDCFGFSRKLGKIVEPLYNENDVNECMEHILGVEYNDIIQITDNVSIKFISSGHIYGACQIILYIKNQSGKITKLAYSGDLGNTLFNQPFVKPFESIEKVDMYIGECTYNDDKRSVKSFQRDKDIELIKNVIYQTCDLEHGTVLIPTFALQRMETILFTLYNIYHNDENFNIPIYVDSPLAVEIIDCFSNNLDKENKDLWDEILNWKNINIIRSIEQSKATVTSDEPKIVCSSSGMLTQGRSILYLKHILPQANSCIILCGYMAEGTIGYKIKNNPIQKTITIDGKAYPNRCNIKALKSFSSHMQYEQLINYYTNLAKNGCEVIWLVHSDDGKIKFKQELENNIKKIGKTTKIIATNFDTVGRI